MQWTQYSTAAALIWGAHLTGCAGTQPPTSELAGAKATIRAAEEVGAEKAPQASVYLKLARDQTSRAERLIEDDENEQAKAVIQRAALDAEVALGLARSANERTEALAAWQKVEDLKKREVDHDAE